MKTAAVSTIPDAAQYRHSSDQTVAKTRNKQKVHGFCGTLNNMLSTNSLQTGSYKFSSNSIVHLRETLPRRHIMQFIHTVCSVYRPGTTAQTTFQFSSEPDRMFWSFFSDGHPRCHCTRHLHIWNFRNASSPCLLLDHGAPESIICC